MHEPLFVPVLTRGQAGTLGLLLISNLFVITLPNLRLVSQTSYFIRLRLRPNRSFLALAIVNANASSHPDLYRALKGGGNKLGVVTRFDFRTFEQGTFWGGFLVLPVNSSMT